MKKILYIIIILVLIVQNLFSQDSSLKKIDTSFIAKNKLLKITVAFRLSTSTSGTSFKTPTYFYVNDGLNFARNDVKYRNLKPYIEKDIQAFKYLKKDRTTEVSRDIFGSICGISVIGAGITVVSGNEEPPSAFIILRGLGFGLTLICKNLHRYFFKKAIKTYNKNAGYSEPYFISDE